MNRHHRALFAGFEIYLRNVGKVSGGVHGCVGLAGDRIIHKGGNGSQRVLGERGGFRKGKLPDHGQVFFLVLFFFLLPLVPHLTERTSVDVFELVAKEGLAVCRTVVETDEVLVAVLSHHIIDKAGSVKVSVGAHLEVHGGAFRLQAHYREQRFVSGNDAAEIHLVVAAQGTAHAAAQPGLHKTGNALVVPTGGIPTRHTHIAPKGRNGLRTVCSNLSPKEFAPAQVLAVVLVRHHDVRVLVAEKLTVTLGRRIHVIGHVEWSHANLDHGTRQGRCAAVTVVLPVGQKQERCLGNINRVRCPDLPVEGLAILEHTDHVGNVPGQVLVKENQPGFIGLILKIGLVLRLSGKRQNQYQYQ